MTQHKGLLEKIFRCAESGDIGALEDAFALIKEIEAENSVIVGNEDALALGVTVYDKENFAFAHEAAKRLRAIASKFVRESGLDVGVDIYKGTLLFDAPYDLDAAIRYAEFNRDFDKKFYEPRRKQLLPVVKAMQELEERKIHTLGVMMPPGVGKTTLEIMFMVWSGYRNSRRSILMGSHSNS